MLTLIENGEIYAPEPRGRVDVLLVGGRIARVGGVDRRAVEALGLALPVSVMDEVNLRGARQKVNAYSTAGA